MPLDQRQLRPEVSTRGYGRDQHAGWGDVSLEVPRRTDERTFNQAIWQSIHGLVQ
jgi:hypothetical protein